jgi:hypothetical protein
MNLPVSFADLAKAANTSASGAYPYSLKGADLDKNFNAVAIDIPTSWVIGAANGQRILNLPAVPGGGTHVLGAVNGSLQWISTEEC